MADFIELYQENSNLKVIKRSLKYLKDSHYYCTGITWN